MEISNYHIGMVQVLHQEQSRLGYDDGPLVYCTQISMATLLCILIQAIGAGVPIGLIQYMLYLLLATAPQLFI